MVYEQAQLSIKPGQESDFEQAMQEGVPLLAGAPGCQSAVLCRGVESPSSYLLLLQWDAVESHVQFTGTDEFARFGELAGPFFAGAPAMEHFAPVS